MYVCVRVCLYNIIVFVSTCVRACVCDLQCLYINVRLLLRQMLLNYNIKVIHNY